MNDENSLRINPKTVAKLFMMHVSQSFPEFEEIEPDELSIQFAKKLHKKFLQLLDDYAFRDIEELIQGGNSEL